MAYEGIPAGFVALWDPINKVPLTGLGGGSGGSGGISDGQGDAPWNGVSAGPSLLSVMKTVALGVLSTAPIGVTISGQPIAVTTGTGGGTAAPVNSAAPTISGTPQAGQQLTTSNGTWSNGPTGYAYQWNRTPSGGSAAPISGATSQTYTPVSGDVGATLTCTVTATNAGGSASSTSAATSAVTAASGGSASFFTTQFFPPLAA